MFRLMLILFLSLVVQGPLFSMSQTRVTLFVGVDHFQVRETIATQNADRYSVIEVKVKGMVCSFCAQGIQKTFEKDPAVLSVTVDLESLWVKLLIVESMAITDAKIRTVIEGAGYSVGEIRR